MIKLLNKSLILILILISTICSAKEEVLFAINNNPITTIDLIQRINYLSIFNDFDINNINKNEYIDDLISVKLFNEYIIRRNLKIEQKEIVSTFNLIFVNNKKKIEELIKNKELTKEIILTNIRYDLQKKKTLESLLNDRINNINLINKNHNIIDIYNLKLNYFIITHEYKEEIIKISNELIKKNISSIKESLNSSKIEYDFYSRKIINFDRINNKIKKIILSNKNTFFIEEANYFMIGIIEKQLKKNIGLKYSFVQIIPKENVNFDIITNELANCSNIEKMKSDSRLEIKEYNSIDLKKLNVDIFQNLSKENDKLIINNNKQKFLILLCKINYNEKMVQDELIQNEVQKLLSEIEMEFVQTKKKEFNFQIFN